MRILSALVTVLACSPAIPQDDKAALAGTERTAHFEIRFRPGSRAEAEVDWILAVVEDDLARVLKELGLREFPHTVRLCLYDDVGELQRLTGVPSGGHSTTLEMHVPCDHDQTRVHELVHVVAEKFAEKGSEPRNMFFAEGLANAVLRFVHGVPVDAVAAFHLEQGQVPPMAEVHAMDDFYTWLQRHPGVNGYDIAGSWMRHLLDGYGPEKVRRYYKGVPAKEAFGKDLEAIEKDWHARLRGLKLRPGLRALLASRSAGPAGARDPEALLGEAVLGPAAEWREVERGSLRPEHPGRWEGAEGREALVLNGRPSDGDWCQVPLGEPLGDAIVRCTAEPLPGCYGVKIQLGNRCQAIVLKGQGTFLYNEVGGVGHDARMQLGDRPVAIVLRRRAGKASIWVDGRLVTAAAIDGSPEPIAVGCVGGPARFTGIAVRRL